MTIATKLCIYHFSNPSKALEVLAHYMYPPFLANKRIRTLIVETKKRDEVERLAAEHELHIIKMYQKTHLKVPYLKTEVPYLAKFHSESKPKIIYLLPPIKEKKQCWYPYYEKTNKGHSLFLGKSINAPINHELMYIEEYK